MFKLLGRTFYGRGLPDVQKAIVDESESKGHLDYFQMFDPVQATLSIVKLVALDPPISMVTRLNASYRKFTSCYRDSNEKLSSFVSRFGGLAANHLLHANTSWSSQIGELLGITLLNNAIVEERTLTNANLQLISHAEAPSKEQ